MTRTRKVQWADDDDLKNTSDKNSDKKSIKSITTKKLVQVKSYSGYADSMPIEKIVQTVTTQRKTQKFDRNLSTVHEESDDGSEGDE